MKKWIMRLSLVVGLLITVTHAGNAQSHTAEYQQLLDKAIELEHTPDLLYKMLVPAFEKNMVSQGLISSEANRQMSEELAAELAPVINNLIKELWSKNFTLEEIRQIVEWLSTTTGQKMLMMTPEMTAYTEQMMQDPANQALIQRIAMKYLGK